MKSVKFIYGITFLLSFCSIVYELILAQALSAFLANTVLRYSITIGLYLFSLGIGSLLAEGRFFKKPLFSLVIIEMLLTILGGFSVVFMFLLDGLRAPILIFSFLAHLLIVIIGILSGFEIPLLIELLGQEKNNKESLILGFNYSGAFVGTILFSFIFYPYLGLVPSGFLVGGMNAFAGIVLFLRQKNELSKSLFYFQLVLFLILVLCLWQSVFLNNHLLEIYLK